MNDDLLRTYMNDHYAGAVAAVELIENFRKSHPESPHAAFMGEILHEIDEDRQTLLGLLDRVGGEKSSIKDAATWIAEKGAKLAEMALDDRLSELLELESLLLGVRGKLALWHSLHAISQTVTTFSDIDFPRLERRAQDQIDRLERQRIVAARTAFAEQ